jgi:hypothetical protein
VRVCDSDSHTNIIRLLRLLQYELRKIRRYIVAGATLQLWSRLNNAIQNVKGGMKIVRFSTGGDGTDNGNIERVVGIDIPNVDIGKCKLQAWREKSTHV